MGKELGARIKYFRNRDNLTQEELAKAVGVATITIRQYESGAREPNTSMIEKISEVLNIGTVFLLPDDYDDMPQNSRESQLLSHFRTLNDNGQTVAVQRVQELAQIPAYKRPADGPQDAPTVPDDKEPAEK